jgi:hypothetical protein
MMSDSFDPELLKIMSLKTKNGQKLSSIEKNTIYSFMVEIYKKGLRDYQEYLWPFLNCASEMLREQAILTLGRVAPLEFREVAYKIWNDPNREELEKSYALGVWYDYFKNTENPQVIEILYKLLTQYTRDILLRKTSLRGIFYVSNTWRDSKEKSDTSLLNIRSHNELNRAIDWERIHSLMQRYAPQVPLVKFEDLPKDSDEEPHHDGYLN